MDWKEELHTIVEDKHKAGGFARGELTKMFDSLAIKYEVSPNTIKGGYYSMNITALDTKADYNNEVSKDTTNAKQSTDTGATLNSDEQKLLSYLRADDKKVPYEVGQVFNVKVHKVVDYGAFVYILDENDEETGYSALIHISEIKDQFVDDPNRHFKVGDVVKAKISKIEKDKQTNHEKIGMITRGVTDLPDYYGTKTFQAPPVNNVLGEKLHEVRDRLTTVVTTSTAKPVKSDDEITQYLANVVGVLSSQASEKLKEIREQLGEFKLGIAIAETEKDFPKDLGLLFLEQVEAKVRERLRRN